MEAGDRMKSFQPSSEALSSLEYARSTQVNDRAPLGQELKSMFDTLTSGPMPDRLVQLADALEEAFKRGELFERPAKLDS